MKKVVSILVFAAMAMTFTACGSKDSSSNNTSTTAATTEAASEADTTAATEADTTEAASENTTAAATDGTVGETLLAAFRTAAEADAAANSEAIANAVMESECVTFMPMVMPIEEGLLTGFGNEEIKGFKEGTVFAPAIGSIPFVGYIFTLDESADADAFMQTLKDNADPRWNICTEAEETVVEKVNDKVFFLMCPRNFEEEEEFGFGDDIDFGGDIALD